MTPTHICPETTIVSKPYVARPQEISRALDESGVVVERSTNAREISFEHRLLSNVLPIHAEIFMLQDRVLSRSSRCWTTSGRRSLPNNGLKHSKKKSGSVVQILFVPSRLQNHNYDCCFDCPQSESAPLRFCSTVKSSRSSMRSTRSGARMRP